MKVNRQAIEKIAGASITVTRGATTSASMIATVGETRSEDFIEDGFVVSVKLRDYIVCASKYIFALSPVVPEKGDIITEVIDGEVTHKWEVLPAGQDPVYRPHDRDGMFFRIHTKEYVEPV